MTALGSVPVSEVLPDDVIDVTYGQRVIDDMDVWSERYLVVALTNDPELFVVRRQDFYGQWSDENVIVRLTGKVVIYVHHVAMATALRRRGGRAHVLALTPDGPRHHGDQL